MEPTQEVGIRYRDSCAKPRNGKAETQTGSGRGLSQADSSSLSSRFIKGIGGLTLIGGSTAGNRKLDLLEELIDVGEAVG